MTQTLKGLGFEVVEVRDGSKAQMADAVARVRDVLKGKQGVGMLYYAGHGLQLEGGRQPHEHHRAGRLPGQPVWRRRHRQGPGPAGRTERHIPGLRHRPRLCGRRRRTGVEGTPYAMDAYRLGDVFEKRMGTEAQTPGSAPLMPGHARHDSCCQPRRLPG
ncbi:hypothetical protein BH11PSE7_BH11PSE7_16010 [soil metagenome]